MCFFGIECVWKLSEWIRWSELVEIENCECVCCTGRGRWGEEGQATKVGRRSGEEDDVEEGGDGLGQELILWLID